MIDPQAPLRGEIPKALLIGYEMSHQESIAIDLHARPVSSPNETKQRHGLKVPTLAVIHAGNQEFNVLDTSEVKIWEPPLLVIDKNFRNINSRCGVGVTYGREVAFGRRYHKDIFEYDPHVSGTHFSLVYNGLTLVVKNHSPLNPTLLSGNTVKDQAFLEGDVRANFTQSVVDRLQHAPEDETAPHGYYQGHKIIGRESKTVKGGVYLSLGSEAVVVDDTSPTLQKATEYMRAELPRYTRDPSEASLQSILERVNEITQTLLPYNDAITDRLSKPHYDNNGLINLSEYVDAGGGVCRHQCLLAAYLMEDLVENGTLSGNVRVERNRDNSLHGAHAWAVLEMPGEQPLVVDPAQDFVGSKSEAQQQDRWKYDLPDLS